MEKVPMEFDSVIRAKKIEAVQHALTARYMENMMQKCKFSTKTSDPGVPRNFNGRLQDTDSESTVPDIFPQVQFTLNSFHQKFHKERWMSWLKTIPKWMVHLVCEDSENGVDIVQLTGTEDTDSEVNMEEEELQHDALDSVECDGITKIRKHLYQVNMENKLILTEWTPMLVPPCELKFTGYLDRTRIKHTTKLMRVRRGSHSFKCVDGTIYELRGTFSHPSNNIPIYVQKLLSKGLPVHWRKMMKIWAATGGNCRSSEEKGTSGSLTSPNQPEEEIQMQKTSHGRIRVPPLKYWLGERVVQRQNRTVLMKRHIKVKILETGPLQDQSTKETSVERRRIVQKGWKQSKNIINELKEKQNLTKRKEGRKMC